ncbi:hypothetical protein K438DRAFT_1580620, partial [Mycena galopus ATCC 62051]
RNNFFSEHGVRWTEFARLKYFDIVKYTVVDPMHNLLLGLAKTQWYTAWIKSGSLRADTASFHRELHTIHEFLESFESPLWAGRLPLRVGEPAGGSLTADEYKLAVTGPWALIIPIVWDRFLKEAKKEFQTAEQRYPAALKEYDKKKLAWEHGPQTSAEPKPPKRPRQRLQEGEDDNFLKFSAFLKIVSVQLYGSDKMKPNHHWAVHIPDQILLFGPLNGFWAFLTERLNKILKNLNSNNWTGGRLEVSMMREFHRSTRINTVVCGTNPCSCRGAIDFSVSNSLVKSPRCLFNPTRPRSLKVLLRNLS